MKKIFLIIIPLILIINICGCESEPDNTYESSANGIHASSEESSDLSVNSDNDESFDENEFRPEEVYKFLLSEYVVTSTRESFGTVYTNEYYLVEGKVAGVKLSTTLSDEITAKEYHEVIADDFPDATLGGSTVTHYIEDDHPYYGFTLDKLEFMLRKSGYEFTLGFDEDEFNAEFKTQKSN